MPLATKLNWLFRIALFLEFAGHGAFGVIGKPGWIPYLTALGFSTDWAWRLQPVIGGVDLALAASALLSPRPVLIVWMATWGLFTALLRPLAGESAFEVLERSYNYGIPFLMFYFQSGASKSLLRDVSSAPERISREMTGRMLFGLRLVMAGMLIGRGALDRGLGIADMAFGIGVLFIDAPAFYAAVFAFKLGSELLRHPAAGASWAWVEVIERGSAYLAPLLYIGFKRLDAGAGEAGAAQRPAPVSTG